MRQVVTGLERIELLSTGGTTSTGTGSWVDLKGGAYSRFSLQAQAKTTGTTAYTVLLQGTLSTLSTSPLTIVSYTQANDRTVKVSTSVVPVNKIRYSISVLGGTSGSSVGFGLQYIYVTGTPA